MPMLVMRHDFRAPAFGPASTADIYTAALDQFRWADRQGWDFAVVSEHHGLDDGWLPAPVTVAGVIAGMTERIPLLLSASIVPLHDPVRLAEQIAVLDHTTKGRIWTVAGAGYRPEEFEMCGADLSRRGKLLEEYVGVMLQAWTGEPFEWRGRTITVTPKPFTQPHPTLLIGGGVEAAARHAARLRLPMMPMNEDSAARRVVRRRSREDRVRRRVRDGTVGPDLRPREPRPRTRVGGDRAVRHVRGPDLRRLPDRGPALDAHGRRRARSTTSRTARSTSSGRPTRSSRRRGRSRRWVR